MKLRVITLLAGIVAALAIAGCGGGGGGGSVADVDTVIPPKAPFFMEATVRPQGSMKLDVEELAENVAGVEDVGQLAVEEIEKAAAKANEPFKYETDVEPWLGEKAGVYLESFDGQDFHGYGFAIQATDTGAAQEFIDKFVKSSSGEALEKGSYEGVDYEIDPEEGQVVGIVGDFLVFAETEKAFKAMVDASTGESLSEQEAFTTAIEAAPSESLANLYVDVGGLIRESGGLSNPETKLFLESAGVEPAKATAVASVVPGSEDIEINFSTNAGVKSASSGDASDLLASFPGGSFAAFASAEFGKNLQQEIDSLDERGIPGELEPGELKRQMSAAGIDLDQLSASIEDLGVFAQGNTRNNLTGAVVFTTTGAREASNTVANIGLLLRASGTPGVTAISGKASGFSIHSNELGSKPLVVAAEGNRIAISYGPAASTQALTATKGATLAEDPAYKEAVAALGDTPISGFVDGPAAVQLASSLIPTAEQEGFGEAKPYLDKVAFVAIGGGSSGDLATSRAIVGFTSK